MVEVKSRRQYSSPLRAEQARATRRAVLDAARALFVAQGYGATTIDQIAERAGVSKPTVFTAVGNKQTLLRAVRDVAIAGDDDAVPVSGRPAIDQIRAQPDLDLAIGLLARHLTGVGRRYGEINEVVHAAADSGDEGARQLWETEEDQRLIGARFWIDVLVAKSPLRRGVTKDAAADALWLLMSPDQYHRLVNRRGWTSTQYERWLAVSIRRLLFREDAGRSRS